MFGVVNIFVSRSHSVWLVESVEFISGLMYVILNTITVGIINSSLLIYINWLPYIIGTLLWESYLVWNVLTEVWLKII